MMIVVQPHVYWKLLGLDWGSHEWYEELAHATGIARDLLKSEVITLDTDQKGGATLSKVALVEPLE